MKSFFRHYFKKPWAIALAIVIILVIIGGGILIMKTIRAHSAASENKPIELAGIVEPANTVNLSFGTGGQVVKVTKLVGDRVKAGEVIAEVENSSLKAQLSAAELALAIDKAKLAELEAGTGTAALAAAQANVNMDNTAVTNESTELLSVLAEDYSLANDSIHTKVDAFFENPTTPNPTLAFSDNDPSVATIESGRVEVETRLSDLQTLSSTASTTDVSSASDSVKEDLAEIKLFLDNVALTINSLSPSQAGVSQGSIEAWKADVSTARANIDDAISATLAADAKLQTASNAFINDEQTLTADQANGDADQIAAQKTVVAKAAAAVQKINTALASTYIISPIDGVVSRQDSRLGAVVPAHVTLVSIDSDSEYQIAAAVSESDASRVAVGDIANVTLDSYGPNVVFQAVVVGINPAQTNGSNTTTLQFENPDGRIKSGMNASVVLYHTSDSIATTSTTPAARI